VPKTASVHKDADQYNDRHFASRHFLGDLKSSAQGYGRPPDCEAPHFELESTDGNLVWLVRAVTG
jgi:hypothetical protein